MRFNHITMSISLTADQEELIQAKLASGKYQTSEEVISTALRLLDEWEKAEAEWVEDTTSKIDAAISASEHTPPVDGESFINGILEKLRPQHPQDSSLTASEEENLKQIHQEFDWWVADLGVQNPISRTEIYDRD